MINNYKVYCLTNTINGKRYIGITKQDVKKRWKNGKSYKPSTRIAQAIKKYGWDMFDHVVLYDGLTKDEASNMEIQLIKEYNTTINGYNVQEGGFNASNGDISEETREKLRLSHKGQHSSPNTEFKKGERAKAHLMIIIPVYCVELDKTFDSIANAEKELNISRHVWDCLKGKRKRCGGYHWKYAKEVI